MAVIEAWRSFQLASERPLMWAAIGVVRLTTSCTSATSSPPSSPSAPLRPRLGTTGASSATLAKASSMDVSKAGLTSASCERSSGPSCRRIETRISTEAFLTPGLACSSMPFTISSNGFALMSLWPKSATMALTQRRALSIVLGAFCFFVASNPWLRTNWGVAASAIVRSASCAPCLSFTSPSFSIMCGMNQWAARLVNLGAFSARVATTKCTLFSTWKLVSFRSTNDTASNRTHASGAGCAISPALALASSSRRSIASSRSFQLEDLSFARTSSAMRVCTSVSSSSVDTPAVSDSASSLLSLALAAFAPPLAFAGASEAAADLTTFLGAVAFGAAAAAGAGAPSEPARASIFLRRLSSRDARGARITSAPHALMSAARTMKEPSRMSGAASSVPLMIASKTGFCVFGTNAANL
mmetsp:Transcript_36101/g.85474  ORF Transcript_36101/g.85474 Transcript_36101/m.85474 type:complete len:414 (+) Transcript_36101:3557-4798(+)